MKKLLLFVLLSCGAMWGQAFYQFPTPFPNGRFYVCQVPASGNPCTNPASIFSDQGLTIPITQPAQIGASGQFGFWAANAQYTIELQAPYNLVYVISLGGGGGGGGLSSFTTGNLPPLFTASLGGAPTSNPALAFTLSTAAANSVFANCTNATGNPSYCALTNAMLPSGTIGSGANGTTNILPLFTGPSTLGNSLFSDSSSVGNYGGLSFGVGTADTSCGAATGCFGATESSPTGSPLPGHDYIRADSSTHTFQMSANGDTEKPLIRSTNLGVAGQVALSNGDGTSSFQDPNISVNTLTLFNAQSATATATSASLTNPLRSGYGTLTISGTGITGSPVGCFINLFYAQASSGVTEATAFDTIFYTPATGFQNFPVEPSAAQGAQGDNIVATYTCGTYPSAGSQTVSYNPAMPVAPSSAALPMNVQQIGGSALSQNIPISHGAQTSTCSANSNAATNTLTISGLTINAGDTVLVGVANGAIVTSAVTDNGAAGGNAYTVLATTSNGSTNRSSLLGTGASAAESATSITVTNSGNAKFVACVTTYVGVQQYGSTKTNTGGGTGNGMSLTTQDNGNWITEFFGIAAVSTYTSTAGNLLAQGSTTATTPASGMLCDNSSAIAGPVICSATSSPGGTNENLAVELRSVAATNAFLPVQLSITQPALTTPLNVQTSSTTSTVGAQAQFQTGASTFGNAVLCNNKVLLNNFSTSGLTQEIAASGSTKIYLCGWTANSASTTALAVKLAYGTGSNCATGTTDFTEVFTLQALASNSPVGFVDFNPTNVVDATPASQAVCISLSAAQPVNAKIYYAQF